LKGLAKEYLIIRADASIEIGTGHVMRCLALAQSWQDSGGKVTFATATDNPALKVHLKSEGMKIVYLSVQPGSNDDAAQTASLAKELGASWVVVDGYHFGAEYQRIIKDSRLRLLFIDDYGHADYYYADIVLNQNLHANEKLYKDKEPYTKLLLGSKYVLLRREFLKWREWKRKIPRIARKVLVTMGGGDPNNVTLKVIQALKQVKVGDLEAVVVIGGNNLHFEELQAAIQNSQIQIRLESNVTDMSKLMAWADIAVSAAGSTSWELMFMNLPSIVLVLAENQRSVAKCLSAKKVAINLGWHESISFNGIAKEIEKLLEARERRVEMAQCSQHLIDGEGAERILMYLKGEEFRLRDVRKEDCKLLWDWVNDPDVRTAAFSSNLIPWKEHVNWFNQKLHDSNSFIFVALDRRDTPVGQVRFDVKDDDEAEIDVSVDSGKRQLGYGNLIIHMGVEKIFYGTPIQTVHAFIKPHNKNSLRAFEKAGFKQLGTEMVKGNLSIHYVKGRDNEQ